MKKVTAGKDALGEFAPLFARLNDDVLFGEVWSREEALSPKIRSILTVAALTVEGVFDSSVEFHMRKAKENGVSGDEIAEILTHLAFYAGWQGVGGFQTGEKYLDGKGERRRGACGKESFSDRQAKYGV